MLTATTRIVVRSSFRGCGSSLRFSHSAAGSSSLPRPSRGPTIALAAGLSAGILAYETSRNRVACDADADRKQRIDPTGPPSGAKIDKAGKQSEVNALEDIRGEGFEVDPVKEQGKYITLAEVAQHHLAHDNWVVVDGKVFE